jgi:CHASE2 domain-containing sensor protein
VDIRVQPHRLDLGYRRGATPAEQRRRRSEIDTLPVFDTAPPRQGDTRFEAGDQILNGRVRVDEAPQWAGRAIPVEQVLAADADQLRGWFGDHAVVIGQMMPGADWHALASGQHVFGCEVQAAALENLLSQVQIARLTPGMVVLRVCGWCAVAALLVSLIPTRATRSPRLALAIGLSSFALGIALASRAGLGATTRESGEVAIALCAFFAVAGPILAVKLLHQRQLHLTPGPVWSPDGTTGSTTWAGTPARRESGL